MIGLTNRHKYYYHVVATDLRKGFDSLSGVIRNEFGMNPCDGSVYIFVNKKRDKMKMLVWESSGFMLYYKRLESGTFEHPKYSKTQKQLVLSYSTLLFMIQGVKLGRIQHRKRYKFV